MKTYREKNDLNDLDRFLSAFYYKPACMESAFTKIEMILSEIGD